ncbi:MAG: sugar-binding protein, partial [bacterium]
SAQTGERVLGGWLYDVPKTTVAPTIDGAVDAVWKTVDWVFQNSYDNGAGVPDSWSDLFGASKLMYDDDNLYGLFYSQDDILDDDHANSWERDNVEFYSDADNSKGDAFDGINDRQFTFQHGWMGSEESHIADLGVGFTGGEFIIADEISDMGGFWLEFRIPLESLGITPTAGEYIGIEWQQDDNDGADREHISKWWLEEGDDSWQVPGHWGTAMLSDRVASENFEIKKLPSGTTPVMDGDFDAIYDQCSQTTQNSHTNGAGAPDNFMDAFIRTYFAYDDDNMYVYWDVYDDILDDDHANSWERDNVEVYFDADNSKGDAFDGINDRQFTIQHGWMGSEESHVADLGVGFTGGEFYISEDDFGYNVEARIPLESLGITPTIGELIGLEIQQDDNDGADREHINKWWLEVGDDSWQVPGHWGTAILGGEIVLDVENPEVVPVTFNLAQNYPNPFNPSTKISYSIESMDKVRLSVFDVLGREVAVLVNDVQNAGSHEVSFVGSNLSSGVYFYKLQTSNAVITKKMLLLK